ncbi:glucosidase 2 subunit beta-like isoform X1 [Asterias amurensis]|uniref:glucosidase 2 subunit beta-like isoform X1 n=1 Tax=Asterias amurensis TaxID=7602 RepID=UPI003AB54A12
MATCVEEKKDAMSKLSFSTNGLKMSVKSYICMTIICFWSVICVATESVPRPRGVSLTNEPLYRDTEWFTCLDGSRRIRRNLVNDDYCDCIDSSDEPGTSACPLGKFHCNNRGFRPKYIPTSRVNDGICDCCDASDEYKGEGAIKCVNNCRELGKADLERRKQEIILMNQGFEVRQEYIKQGAEKKVEREESITKLREEKELADQIKEEKDKLKQEAEAPETEAKDAHKKLWEAQLELIKEAKEKQKTSDAFDELDLDENGRVSPDELLNHKEFDADGDGVVSEDEAKAVLKGLDQAQKSTFTDIIWPSIKGKFISLQQDQSDETTPPTTQEEGDGGEPYEGDMGDPGDDYDPGEDVDDAGDEEDDEEYDKDMDQEAIMEKYRRNQQEKEKKEKGGEDEEAMPEYDEATQVLIEAADKARDDFKAAEKRSNDIKRSIEDLEKLLRVDLGPHQEFQPLQNQCFEFTDREYTYKLCPFDKTSQRPKSGGSETSLGTWGQWEGPVENRYIKMKYSGGKNCWNGPDRSTMVILRCGTENKLLAASEPERCTYEFEFETPALCTIKTDPQTGETDNHDEL